MPELLPKLLPKVQEQHLVFLLILAAAAQCTVAALHPGIHRLPVELTAALAVA